MVGKDQLDQTLRPSHVVKYAGLATTAGGAVIEDISVPGVLVSDVVQVTLKEAGSTARTIVTAEAVANIVRVTFSGDPSNDHEVFYTVLRAV